MASPEEKRLPSKTSKNSFWRKKLLNETSLLLCLSLLCLSIVFVWGYFFKDASQTTLTDPAAVLPDITSSLTVLNIQDVSKTSPLYTPNSETSPSTLLEQSKRELLAFYDLRRTSPQIATLIEQKKATALVNGGRIVMYQTTKQQELDSFLSSGECYASVFKTSCGSSNHLDLNGWVIFGDPSTLNLIKQSKTKLTDNSAYTSDMSSSTPMRQPIVSIWQPENTIQVSLLLQKITAAKSTGISYMLFQSGDGSRAIEARLAAPQSALPILAPLYKAKPLEGDIWQQRYVGSQIYLASSTPATILSALAQPREQGVPEPYSTLAKSLYSWTSKIAPEAITGVSSIALSVQLNPFASGSMTLETGQPAVLAKTLEPYASGSLILSDKSVEQRSDQYVLPNSTEKKAKNLSAIIPQLDQSVLVAVINQRSLRATDADGSMLAFPSADQVSLNTVVDRDKLVFNYRWDFTESPS